MSILKRIFGKMNPSDKTAKTTYQEKHNQGTRQDTVDKATAFWLARNVKQRFEPYLLYIFESEANARDALLELNCIHIATDTGQLICTETLDFGCYENESGKFEAILCGNDLTEDLWSKARKSFNKHGGTKKNNRNPQRRIRTRPRRHLKRPNRIVSASSAKTNSRRWDKPSPTESTPPPTPQAPKHSSPRTP